MLDKNKTYNYEELKDIVMDAVRVTMNKLDTRLKEASKKAGDKDSLVTAMMGMQNMMVCTRMAMVILGEEGEDEDAE